jgi:hypothetical protein
LTIYGGSNGQVLSTDGAGNLSFTSNVANAGYADIAGTANSVSRGNVSGAGTAGALQFTDTVGNLTSSDRYYIGANGAANGGYLNISRDSGFAVYSYIYANPAASFTMVTARARGTKAAPLPVQVNDRVFGLTGQIYTGTGTGTSEGITGWTPLGNSGAISIDVTALPTSNTSTYGSRVRIATSNATSNTTIFTDFRDDGTLDTPKLRVSVPNIPASATATGIRGDIAYDTDFIYVCVAANTWKRSALTTW